MNLFFWRRDKVSVDAVEDPKPPRKGCKGSLQGQALNAKEHAMLYELMHALDGIKLYRRVIDSEDYPYRTSLERAKLVAGHMAHFASLGIIMEWDDEDVKSQILSYERSLK